MTQKPFQQSVLSEELRFAYLHAMGIDCWEPRIKSLSESPPTLTEATLDTGTSEKRNKKIKTETRIATKVTTKQSAVLQKENTLSNQFEANQPEANQPNVNQTNVNQTEAPHPEKHQLKKSQVENDEINKNLLKSPHFLKWVNWSNQQSKQQNNKELLIICRHQIDQPANSFALANSPSQFMLDYINGLLGLIEKQSFAINIQLAHLSEAGLSAGSIPMRQLVEEKKPDLILLLGDETVSHLLGCEANVSNSRGRLANLWSQSKALVSYHPFSLIKNPSLKPLAFEDLYGLVDFFSEKD